MQRLLSIDCLRGLAALGVVFHHACLYHPAGFPAGHPVTILEEVLNLGFTGVWLFFVLSGFCIHLRTARAAAAGSREPIGVLSFWKRRITRLYPAYLVSLFLYAGLSSTSGIKLDGSLVYNLVVHILMIHNFDLGTAFGFCGVFWTLALEEQLYLAYFILLALRNRLGWRWTLVICLAARIATYVVHALAKRQFGIDVPIREMATAQWFVWALGAVAVEAYLGLVVLPRWCRDLRVGVGLLGMGVACITFVRHFPASPFCKSIWFALDPLLGLGFFVLLNGFVASEATWRSYGRPPKLFRRLARIGLFSYSLYLTHEIVITHFSGTFARWCRVENNSLFMLSLTPVCLALGWVFFQLFERPFLHGSSALPAARLMAPVAKRLPASPL